MRHQFEAFIDDLRETHGKNLASVILYGSAAADDGGGDFGGGGAGGDW